MRDAKEPGRRVFRQTCRRPRLKRLHQGTLNGVLNNFDVLHSYPARKYGDKLAVFVPEEVLNQPRWAQGVFISRTSTPDPGLTSPGTPLAISMASSRLFAETII